MHLNTEAMIDLIEGRGENSHIEECSDCRRSFEEWHQLHTRLQGSHLQDAPAALLRAAYGIMEPRPKLGATLASMIFDSFTQPAFAGARGAGTARQLVLRAEEFDVHVKITGEPQNRQINGQILSRGVSGFIESAKIHLLQNGLRIQSAVLDALGEFEFATSTGGTLSLQIDLPTTTVIGSLVSEEVA